VPIMDNDSFVSIVGGATATGGGTVAVPSKKDEAEFGG